MSNICLPINWSETNLGSLGKFFRGRGGTRSDEMDNGLPCIRYGDLYTHHDCIVNSFCSTINPSRAYLYSLLQTGDVVFAASGETFEEIGKAAAYCGVDKAYAGGDTIIFRPSSNFNSYFAGYTVNSHFASKCKSRLGQGSSVIHISADHLASIHIRLPPIQQQKKIATVFQTIDRTIAKTEALIEKYQQIKAGLMHDLFTRGIGADGKLRSPREEAPELYQETAIGWIPKEWKIQTVENLGGLVTSGSREWAKYYSKEGALFIRIGNLTREHINFRFDNIQRVLPPKESDGQRTKLIENDILVSITADLGIIGVIPETIGDAYSDTPAA